MDIKENFLKRIKKKYSKKIDVSLEINIYHRMLNVGQDIARFISLNSSLLAVILKDLRFPLNLLNIGLQLTVILFDKNYPPNLKALNLAALGFMAILTLGIWFLAPATTLLLVGLTISTHFITLFYRANKFKSNLDNYFSGPSPSSDKDKILFSSIVIKYQRLKKLIEGKRHKKSIREAEEDLDANLEQYYLTINQEKIKNHRFERVLISGLGVALILLRGVAAVLLLTLATSTPALMIPLLLVSLFCNAGDLIRNLYTKFQTVSVEEEKLKKKSHLIDELELLNKESVTTSDDNAIFKILHLPETKSEAQEELLPNSSHQKGLRFFQREKSIINIDEHNSLRPTYV